MGWLEIKNKKQAQPLSRWRKLIITYLDGESNSHVSEEVTTLNQDDFIKSSFPSNRTVLSVQEIAGKSSAGACPVCDKPFVTGEAVYNTEFVRHTIGFLDERLGYFAEKYEGEDSLDIREQLRYLVHASHVSTDQIDEHERGKKMWRDGMNICDNLRRQFWK